MLGRFFALAARNLSRRGAYALLLGEEASRLLFRLSAAAVLCKGEVSRSALGGSSLGRLEGCGRARILGA